MQIENVSDGKNRAEHVLVVLDTVKNMYSGIRNEIIQHDPTKVSGFIPEGFSAKIVSSKDQSKILLSIKLSGRELSDFEIIIPRSENISVSFAKEIRKYFIKNGFGLKEVIKPRRLR